jgi:UDP-N-acetyl-2-amino-2-deoxyglucuronate dehydrogenase
VDLISICSPNYLHDSHIRYALRYGAHAICEKPLVLNPWNFDALAEMEAETGKRVFTILQLRLHPSIRALREKIQGDSSGKQYLVELRYVTSRGNWYRSSWKGDEAKSGGIATNIGIHFFDMLIWIFGPVKGVSVESIEFDHASGFLELERAGVKWFLSINEEHLPTAVRQEGKRTFRSLTLENEEIEFSEGFTDLHTRSYEEILAGKAFGLEEARPSIDLVHKIRSRSH